MRFSPLLLAGLVCLAIAVTAGAETVEVLVPDLAGPYPVSEGVYGRSATITLPKLPVAISGASFRLVGTGTVGAANCGGIGHLDSWPMEYIAEMSDEQGSAWIAFHDLAFLSGQFVTYGTFEPVIDTASWNFLLDGQGEVVLTGAPWSALGSCDPVILPTGTVTEAYFVLEGDFELPVEPTTWGKIKSLYR